MKISPPNMLMSVMVLALAACSAAEPHKHKRHVARSAAPSGVEEAAKVEPASGGCVSCGVVSGVVESKPATDALPDKDDAQTQ